MRMLGLRTGLVAAGLLAACLRGGDGWETDWAKVKAAAAKDGRTILLEFTGSDWCGWCIKLKKEVLSQDAFRSYATANFILMEADYPRKLEQSAELKEQNRQLQQQFGVTGFPTILLLDPQGTPFARSGYRPGGAEDFVAYLKTMAKVQGTRDEFLAKAAAAQGVERARLLAAALKPVPTTLLGFYADTIKQIQALDPENQTGFKARLIEMDIIALEETVRRLTRDNRRDEGLAKVDAFIAANGLTGELQQKALLTKLRAYPPTNAGNLSAADVLIDQVVAIDGATPTAKQCAAVKERTAQARQHLAAKPPEKPADPPGKP